MFKSREEVSDEFEDIIEMGKLEGIGEFDVLFVDSLDLVLDLEVLSLSFSELDSDSLVSDSDSVSDSLFSSFDSHLVSGVGSGPGFVKFDSGFSFIWLSSKLDLEVTKSMNTSGMDSFKVSDIPLV